MTDKTGHTLRCLVPELTSTSSADIPSRRFLGSLAILGNFSSMQSHLSELQISWTSNISYQSSDKILNVPQKGFLQFCFFDISITSLSPRKLNPSKSAFPSIKNSASSAHVNAVVSSKPESFGYLQSQ
ncbi:hypothetical protein Tco_0014522 [Tanacetum coccineum]